MGDNKNFFPFLAISMAILIGYQYLVAGPKNEAARLAYEQQQAEISAREAAMGPTLATGDLTAPSPNSTLASTPNRSNSIAYQAAGFVRIETPELSGSISLRGAHFDDLTLVKHKESMDDGADNVR
ncbi:MAG: YidC/Oxa1 family insertase periplasmic-domain containing protein [Kordiimonadaceae bacterium]|nr:YidC/Oxa1 family insertase periplasmic-domain containing protein [Kordiimonadaceae bacterium]